MTQNLKLTLSFPTKLINIFKYEKLRLISKGYWLIVSLLTFVFYFTCFPDILSYIWPTFLKFFTCKESIDLEKQLYVFTVTFVNAAIMIIYSIVMYFIYKGKYKFFEQYRISNELWPWESDYSSWLKLLNKSILNISLNLLIICPILVYLDTLSQFTIKMKLQDLPHSKITYFYQFCVFLLANQIWGFFMHAILHHPRLYWIHKLHHEYSIPISLAGLYVHPIQYIFSSYIATGLGLRILLIFQQVHIFSLIIWLIFRVVEINDCHNGYDFPWVQSILIPFNTGETYHYFHHRTNLGNYAGMMYIWDSIFGFNRKYWEYQDKMKGKISQYTKVLHGKQL